MGWGSKLRLVQRSEDILLIFHGIRQVGVPLADQEIQQDDIPVPAAKPDTRQKQVLGTRQMTHGLGMLFSGLGENVSFDA